MTLENKLLIPALVVLTSCYFFPFVLAAFPVANSKMLMAAAGLVLFIVNLAKKQNAGLDKEFLELTLWAIAISVVAFVSTTINHTPDDTFSLYIVSMWVWIGGAYALIVAIKGLHGGVSVPLVVNYLLAVCVIQCILALVFDNSLSAAEWSENTFSGEAYMGNTDEDRLHGIGCSLDVAGFRFAAVICMTSYILYRQTGKNAAWRQLLYISAICFVTVVGNMISRSTVIGSAMGLIFIICAGLFSKGNRRLLGILTGAGLMGVVMCTYLYNTNEIFAQNLRFGFEGFFSLAETGEWRTNSNDILKNMVVWPDNARTWIIGDGYINNPNDKTLSTFDPYYVGENYGGYYRGTDIGYLRYIFYFGVVGLGALILYYLEICRMLSRRFKAFKWLFVMVLVMNFIQWFKVSSDLFMVFAPFFCFTAKENDMFLANKESAE